MAEGERIAALRLALSECQQKAKADLVIFVSDNESWVDQGRGLGTALMAEWSEFRQRNPKARLVCLDVQPNRTTQAAERADILNIGGFSDQVFELISVFASGKLEADHWVGRIEAVGCLTMRTPRRERTAERRAGRMLAGLHLSINMSNVSDQ